MLSYYRKKIILEVLCSKLVERCCYFFIVKITEDKNSIQRHTHIPAVCEKIYIEKNSFVGILPGKEEKTEIREIVYFGKTEQRLHLTMEEKIM